MGWRHILHGLNGLSLGETVRSRNFLKAASGEIVFFLPPVLGLAEVVVVCFRIAGRMLLLEPGYGEAEEGVASIGNAGRIGGEEVGELESGMDLEQDCWNISVWQRLVSFLFSMLSRMWLINTRSGSANLEISGQRDLGGVGFGGASLRWKGIRVEGSVICHDG